jgi:hypothetical protein
MLRQFVRATAAGASLSLFRVRRPTLYRGGNLQCELIRLQHRIDDTAWVFESAAGKKPDKADPNVSGQNMQ